MGRAIVVSLVLSTLLISVGNIALAPEDDPRLGHAIAIFGWAVSIYFGWREFQRLGLRTDQNSETPRRQFKFQGILIGVAALGLAFWFGLEVWRAEQRRALLQDFIARGGETRRERIPGFWVLTTLIVPNGQFTKEELSALQSAYPDAAMEDEPRPVVSRTP